MSDVKKDGNAVDAEWLKSDLPCALGPLSEHLRMGRAGKQPWLDDYNSGAPSSYEL